MAKQSRLEFPVVPKGASGCVVVFHEVWGLVEHTEDVCKRVSKLGFAYTAPNLYKGHSELLSTSLAERPPRDPILARFLRET